MDKPLLKVEIEYEHDVVLARQRARQIAELLGFESQDQVRIATAVSELARNAFRYADGGKVRFSLTNDKPQNLRIDVIDNGKGIPHLDKVLKGTYESNTGMGLGLIGVQRLMDDFDIRSSKDGTAVKISKKLPRNSQPISNQQIANVADALATQISNDPFHEMQRQNQELLATLDEVQKQRAVLAELNQELEETNRGVVALYAELDERADYLKRASELKTQFLSNMTHEFRTPLNSITSISQLLLERMDGELNEEQEKQVTFIHQGARTLTDLVNDLLDLAKVEAGKVTIRPSSFEVVDMFGMLRGMLKPLIDANRKVALVFDKLDSMPPIFSDEGKVSQILRNFISNGIKYTESGQVRISAKLYNEETIIFSVTDTGIGISPEEHGHIFEEFTQIEGTHQNKIKGTGLGLPLARKLADLLGGRVKVKSTPGKGSTFSLFLPIRYAGLHEVNYDNYRQPVESHKRVLVIDDNSADRYVVKKIIGNVADIVAEATGGMEGLEMAENLRPAAIILDLVMGDMKGGDVLKTLKQQPSTKDIPVIIYSSKTISAKERKTLLSHAHAVFAKGLEDRDSLVHILKQVLGKQSGNHSKSAGMRRGAYA